MPYVIRALSLVPEDLRFHLELEQVQYVPLHRIFEYDYHHHESRTRA